MANRQVYTFWDYFRRLGIADDVTIIGHLAKLLAEQHGLTPPAGLEYDPLPTNLTDKDKEDIAKSLSNMSTWTDIGSAARLFDPFFVFELTETLPGERYPTPRHLAQFMLRIADVRPEHDLADLACGSGGMLAWRQGLPTGRTVGYEISPTWARLAWTNCALRSFPQLEINPDDALNIAVDGDFAQVDRVVMNPPFGKVPVRVGEQTPRSETAFIEKALTLLKEAGRMAVLVPAGSLFSKGRELALRQTLISDHQLDAVIELPKDAFQPFSQIRAYVLLASKQAAPETQATWFVRCVRDGYPAGRGRDLTDLSTERRKTSDLPLVEALLTAAPIPKPADEMIQWRSYKTDEQRFYTIEALADATTITRIERLDVPTRGNPPQVSSEALADATTITRIERLDVPTRGNPPQVSSFLEIYIRQGESSQSRVINTGSGEIMPVGTEREAWIKAQVGLERLERLSPIAIYNGRGATRAVAFATDWRVLAVQIPRTELQTTQNYELQPERYVSTEDERGPLRPPGTLLADIRRNQRQLAARVDGMLGRIEAPPISDGNLLIPLWEAPELELLLGLLSDEQKQVLEAVQRQIWLNTDQSLRVPKHFVSADLQLHLPNAIIYQTLDLLERVGLIVRVTLLIEEQGRIDAYRLTHERDRWQVPETGTQE